MTFHHFTFVINFIESISEKNNISKHFITVYNRIPYGLVVRILAFHAGGPGSIPGVGKFYFIFYDHFNNVIISFLPFYSNINHTNLYIHKI